MSLYDKISQVLLMRGQSRHSERICSELNFAASLSTAKNSVYDETVGKAADYLLAKSKDDGGVITRQTAEEAEAILLPLSPAAKSYRVHCVAHAHIDMNWMWGYQETASVTIDTFRTMLDLMKEYPDFTFAQSQASTYKIVEELAPDMLDEIRQRVREGRWEVAASTWVENDQNMPCGESMARHILYSKRYLSKLLDIPQDSLKLNFQPDTFGHNASVPEICGNGGVKYYYHCRGNKDRDFTYVWRARGGSELLVWYDPFWYLGVVEYDMFRNIPQYCDKYGIDCFLRVYGVGDHGGGPTRRDIERLREMSSWPVMPDIFFSTYSSFFAELDKFRSVLPVREGELNFVFTGCYTSQSKIKMANRIAEDKMNEAEFLGALANSAAGARKYNEQFGKAWEGILFNHFHDILPGSGMAETREYALGQFQRSMAAVDTGANIAMRALASAIDTSPVGEITDTDSLSEGAGTGFSVDGSSFYGFPIAERGNGKKRLFHFFNPTQYDFDGVTELVVWDWKHDASRAVITGVNGEEFEKKIIEKDKRYWMHYYDKFAVKIRIPAFGYTTCVLDEREIADNRVGPTNGQVDVDLDDDIILENNRVKAVFSHGTMELISFTDKESGAELISSPSASFALITENSERGASSWKVGDYMTVVNINRESKVFLRRADTDGIRKSVSFDMKFGERSKLEVRIVLDDNSPALVYECKCDFHEIGNPAEKEVPQLNFRVPFGYRADEYLYDIPFGIIPRPPLNQDVPANSFGAAVPEDRTGGCLMLVSDSKYGFRGTADSLSLSLIRASYDPDLYPEYGIHDFRIGICACGNASHTELYKNASAFVHKCSFCSARPGKGILPMENSLFTVEGDVKVTTVKNPEDGDGLVVRVHNVGDAPADFALAFTKPVTKAYETDINENILSEIDAAGNRIRLSTYAYGIKTVLVRF